MGDVHTVYTLSWRWTVRISINHQTWLQLVQLTGGDLKNNICSHIDVSHSDGGPIVAWQSFSAMSHSHNPRWSKGLREGYYFSHTGIKPQSGGLPSWLMHREKKELTNHNNNHHHPAVSTVASPHSISAITQFRSLLKMRQYCCWISCVSAYVCAEHANCSVLLVTSVSQPVMGHILVGLFTWLSSLKWSSGAWLYCLMQSRLCGVLIKTEQSGRLAVV